MVDDRLEQLSEAKDGETTLRDGSRGEDGTVELSASDIVAVEEVESDTTQVIEQSQLECLASDDSEVEEPTTELCEADLRTTTQHEAVQGMTTERQVPEALLDETVAKTQKMKAVGTQPLPSVDVAEETAVRSTDSGEWAELDDEGFYTFIASVDDQGRVKLPRVLFEGREPGDGVTVFVRAKVL
jgi:hypothetical protein